MDGWMHGRRDEGWIEEFILWGIGRQIPASRPENSAESAILLLLLLLLLLLSQSKLYLHVG
jgi:hypothetical protein